MTRSGVVLSFGGGGFSHGTDPELDDFCFRFLPPMPDIGYIGWANRDDETRIAKFHSRFAGMARSLSHLPMQSSAARARDWVQGKQMIYLGGGNTADLIAALSGNQTGAALASANRGGCVLAGVSAGGACWFDWILSDSCGNGYHPLDGLSAIRGGICPHYSSEPARKHHFEAAVFRSGREPAYAVDDGACLVSADGRVESYFSARSDRAAYRLFSQDDGGVTRRLGRFS